MFTEMHKSGSWVREVVAILCGGMVAVPLYLLFVVSLKGQVEMTRSPLSLPQAPAWSNYTRAYTEALLGQAFMSGVSVVLISLLFIVVAGSLAAYVLVRRSGGLSNALFFVVVAGMVIPFQLGMIPLYQMMAKAGLVGSVWSLVVFYSGVQMPFTVFLYAGFIRAMPLAFEEAARMDGASSWQMYRLVVFPMLRPITITVVVLNGVFIWNDFLTPLLYLSGSEYQTIPVAVYAFVGQYASDWGLVFAGLVIAAIPVLTAYLFLQRHLIAGFAGGIKG